MFFDFWANVVTVISALVVVGALGKVWRWMRPAAPTESPSEAGARDLVLRGKKLEAMKMIRQLRGITLTEAKHWAENVDSDCA